MSGVAVARDQSRLLQRIEELDEEVRQLRALLALEADLDWHRRTHARLPSLARAPRTLLRLLLERPVLSHAHARLALTPAGTEGGPESNVVSTYLVHIRAALRRHGITVRTMWREGYYLDATDRAALRELLAGPVPERPDPAQRNRPARAERVRLAAEERRQSGRGSPDRLRSAAQQRERGLG